ncbi:MAG: alpha/beta fold hydrolase [Polyangiales bacterium]
MTLTTVSSAVLRRASLPAASLRGLDTWRQAPAFIDVGHSRLAYRRVGNGPDLLFVHGWPVSSSTFREVAATLAEEFTCHLFDLPGAGLSTSTGDAPTELVSLADTTARVIDALHLKKVALVAHNSGGAISRLAAVQRPNNVRCIVSGNTEIPHHRPFVIRALKILARTPGGAGVLKTMLHAGWLRRSRAIGFGSSFTDLALLAEDSDFYALTLAPLLADPRRLVDSLGFIRTFDFAVVDALERAHAQIQTPTRLIWGARDRVFPLRAAKAMMSQFAGPVDLVEIPEGRLFAHEEFPHVFAAHAREFLRAL